MKGYLLRIKNLISIFTSFDIQGVPRSENSRVDLLSKLSSSALGDLPKESFFEVVRNPVKE